MTHTRAKTSRKPYVNLPAIAIRVPVAWLVSVGTAWATPGRIHLHSKDLEYHLESLTVTLFTNLQQSSSTNSIRGLFCKLHVNYIIFPGMIPKKKKKKEVASKNNTWGFGYLN
jgi:hypothetical protein